MSFFLGDRQCRLMFLADGRGIEVVVGGVSWIFADELTSRAPCVPSIACTPTPASLPTLLIIIHPDLLLSHNPLCGYMRLACLAEPVDNMSTRIDNLENAIQDLLSGGIETP